MHIKGHGKLGLLCLSSRIDTTYSGLVTRFPTIFSIICSVAFFGILFLILATCLLPSILHSSSTTDDAHPPEQPDDNDPGAPLIDDRQPEEYSDSETDASGLHQEKDEKPSKSVRRRNRRSKNKGPSEASVKCSVFCLEMQPFNCVFRVLNPSLNRL